MTAVGVLFTAMAVLGWRHRGEDSISLAEAAILKMTGVEPLPISRFDRWLHRFQLVMATILGPLAIVIGGIGVLTELGLI